MTESVLIHPQLNFPRAIPQIYPSDYKKHKEFLKDDTNNYSEKNLYTKKLDVTWII